MILEIFVGTIAIILFMSISYLIGKVFHKINKLDAGNYDNIFIGSMIGSGLFITIIMLYFVGKLILENLK